MFLFEINLTMCDMDSVAAAGVENLVVVYAKEDS
jgi:hypothetical protein